MNIRTKFLYLSCLLFIGISANAHHSFSATFKSDAKIEIEGVVTSFSFRNPHVNILIDVTDPDGSITQWVSEGAAATNLRRAGWDRNSLKADDLVRISGDSTHDGSPMIASDIVSTLNSDGSVLMTLSSNQGDQAEAYAVAETETEDNGAEPGERGPGGRPGGPQGGPGSPGGLAGRGPGGPNDARGVRTNFTQAPSIPLLLADGRPNLTSTWDGFGAPFHSPRDPIVRFTARGEALQAAFNLANDPQVFCDAPGLVRQTGMTPHPLRITQFDDRVEFEYEEYAGAKVVYFDPAVGQKSIPTHLGDSVARYEGNVLIVETHNLLPDLATAEGNSLTDEALVTQFYSRIDEDQYGSMIMIKTVVTDPHYLAEDIVLENVKMASASSEFIEVACTEPLRERVEVHPAMSFFLTSTGIGDGANLGGLQGADAHCEVLADSMGQGGKDWKAYLSTVGENGVNARDRIGSGPWYNAEGTPIARNIDELHSDSNSMNKATVVTERAESINGRGETPNRHDILTGSSLDGTAMASDSDITCNNWQSNSEEGSALVGHFDREGGGQNPTSWNQAHPSNGCSQSNLQSTGGDGLFYCFAAGDNYRISELIN